MGFGIETDIRDYNGVAVISHDPPRKGSLALEEFFDLYKKMGNDVCLALNVKSDGLDEFIHCSLSQRQITNYFCFDMSVPDSLKYFSRSMKVYTRRSEYEAGSSLDMQAQGLWLDAFIEPYVPINNIIQCANEQKNYCLVSPELHSKPYEQAWSFWKKTVKESSSVKAAICTDFPDKAKWFFEG